MQGIALELSEFWTALVQLLAFDPTRLLEPEMLLRMTLQGLLLTASAFFSSS